VSDDYNADQKRFITNVSQNNLKYVIGNHHMFEKEFIDQCFLIACYACHSVDVIKYLANELKINISYVDKKNNNGFLLACTNNSSLEVLKCLVNELKCDVIRVNDHGHNGFTIACKHNPNLDIIKYLVNELKIDTTRANVCNHNGFLNVCMCNSNPDVIKYLVEDLKFNIKHTSTSKRNGFTLACQYNPNLNAIKYLSECSNIKQDIDLRFGLIRIGKFDKIIMNQVDTKNYSRFMELLTIGIKYYTRECGYAHVLRLLKKINSIMLTKSIINDFKIDDPFDNKFKTFVKLFNGLSISVKNFYASTS
jgi:hypothetical protein